MANTVRIRLRTDTSANWESANPVLLKGEPAFDSTAHRLYQGDGETAFQDQERFFQALTAEQWERLTTLSVLSDEELSDILNSVGVKVYSFTVTATNEAGSASRGLTITRR